MVFPAVSQDRWNSIRKLMLQKKEVVSKQRSEVYCKNKEIVLGDIVKYIDNEPIQKRGRKRIKTEYENDNANMVSDAIMDIFEETDE